MGDAEVGNQAPAGSLVPLVIADLHVTTPLPQRHAAVGADRVSGCQEERDKGRQHQVVRLG